jgi:hypothetical protein
VAVADVLVEVLIDEVEDVAAIVVAVEEVARPVKEAAKDKKTIYQIHQFEVNMEGRRTSCTDVGVVVIYTASKSTLNNTR